ncbi:Uncharacterised protein [Candidatus Burarchaeum australiense]|nr:Uncharacterised protein [Candidatus Burarchaeum australiense]
MAQTPVQWTGKPPILRAKPLPMHNMFFCSMSNKKPEALGKGLFPFRLLDREVRVIQVGGNSGQAAEKKKTMASMVMVLENCRPPRDEIPQEGDGKEGNGIVGLRIYRAALVGCTVAEEGVDGKKIGERFVQQWLLLEPPDPKHAIVRAQRKTGVGGELFAVALPVGVIDRRLWAPVRAMETLTAVESDRCILEQYGKMVRLKSEVEAQSAIIREEAEAWTRERQELLVKIKTLKQAGESGGVGARKGRALSVALQEVDRKLAARQKTDEMLACVFPKLEAPEGAVGYIVFGTSAVLAYHDEALLEIIR